MIPWLVLLVAAAACSDNRAYPIVTIKGTSLPVEWIRSDPQRRTQTLDRGRFPEERGILIGWSHDRIQHYFSKGTDSRFEVLFLAADGRVMERQPLPADSEEGITSKAEARYALFLPEGWLARHAAGDADRIAFSDAITSSPPDPLPEVRLGDATLHVEVSVKQEDRERGLMHRRTMSADDGMIFVFEREDWRSFWMGNCHYSLDIAFFDGNGAFINVVPMDPYPDPKGDPGLRAPSARPAMYVVEAHKGWFKAKGLVDGGGKARRPLRIENLAAVRELAGRRSGW